MQERIADFEKRLGAVEQRLCVLEGAVSGETALARDAPQPSLGEDLVGNASTHIGRVLLIFGGAYLLRAMTDFRFVQTALGIAMGASYALFWLVMAYRNGSIRSQRASAAFFGATSVILALPLMVEATGKFQLLSGGQGVGAISFYCLLALAAAVSRDLKSLAWLLTAGGIAAAFAVLIVSHAAIPVAAHLLLLGLASLWAVYWRSWMGVQWLGALGANAGVLALIVFSRSDQWTLEPRLAALMATVLLLSYLLSFAFRSHVRALPLGIFEAVQAPIAAGIAFWAASVAAQAGHFSLFWMGTLSVVLGAAAYVLAFSKAARSVRGRNFYYYSTLGLLFVVAGSALILPPAMAAACWSILALVTAWLSGRTGWLALSLQCTVLLLAAGVASGILTAGLQAFAGHTGAGWPSPDPWHIGVALTTVACLFLPVAQRSERWGVLAGLPQLVVLALSVWEVGGLMIVYLAPIIAGTAGQEPNLAALAALRTAVLSASSVTLALSCRFRRWPEARWLVYPVLILVAIKLFLEDFPNGQPASLFVALFFVGSALLLVARLLKRDWTAAPET